MQKAIPNAAIDFILFGIQAAAPTIAALIVFAHRGELKVSLSELFGKKHLIRSVLLPMLITCVTMLSAKMIYCAAFSRGFSFGEISQKQNSAKNSPRRVFCYLFISSADIISAHSSAEFLWVSTVRS